MALQSSHTQKSVDKIFPKHSIIRTIIWHHHYRLLCSRYYDKRFFSFNSHNNCIRQEIPLFPTTFKLGSEKSENISQMMEGVSGNAKILTSRSQTPKSKSFDINSTYILNITHNINTSRCHSFNSTTSLNRMTTLSAYAKTIQNKTL